MNSIRVAHMADFHIGSDLRGSDRLKVQVNNSLLKSLNEIIKMLNGAKTDLILIAGDFYESSYVDAGVLGQVKDILASFNGKIVIAPGNHDYVSVESVYLGRWPENVHIFTKEEIDYLEFSEISTRVYGFAFTRSHIEERKLQEIAKMDLDDAYINIGLAHGQIDSVTNSYNPIYKEDIANSGLDYLALGHVHKRSEIEKLGNTYFAYAGNPVGRGFDETGYKGIYFGEISKYKNGMNFYKIDNSQFHILELDLEDFSSQAIIATAIREKLEEFGLGYRKNYYRILIKGFIEEGQSINIDFILSQFDDIQYLELMDETRLKIDIDTIKNEKSLKGLYVKNVLSSNYSQKDMDALLDIGMKALEDLL